MFTSERQDEKCGQVHVDKDIKDDQGKHCFTLHSNDTNALGCKSCKTPNNVLEMYIDIYTLFVLAAYHMRFRTTTPAYGTMVCQ